MNLALSGFMLRLFKGPTCLLHSVEKGRVVAYGHENIVEGCNDNSTFEFCPLAQNMARSVGP